MAFILELKNHYTTMNALEKGNSITNSKSDKKCPDCNYAIELNFKIL